ncbi:MAG: peptide ABC transporter substrate-binding protein [Gammaproteobacteria bacterium]|nr:peptide ABC transporter substrate-binding protein [Gammaproteobacteria bacterium]
MNKLKQLGAIFFFLSFSAVSAPDVEQLAENQVLHRGNGLEPETLDPHRARGAETNNIIRDLYEGLTREGPRGEVLPGAAERWQVSDDGKTYTFFIREDARWSNGEAVTAHDFVAGFRRTVDPATGSHFATGLRMIRNVAEILSGDMPPEKMGVTALDDRRLRMTLNSPTPYLLQLLHHPSNYPVYMPSIEEHGDRFTRPGNNVSNGAYSISDWVVNSHITAKRNEFYWNSANVRIDEVYYHVIEDENSELNRFRAGELDTTRSIPVARYEWLRENMPEEVRVTPYLSTYFYGVNSEREPFKDNRELRQALSMAIDRDVIAEKVMGVGEVPAYGWVPPGIENYTSQVFSYKDLPRTERIAQAKQLYRQAGYSEENPLEVEIRFNTSENHRRIAIAVASMWKEYLGVEVELVNEEWKVFLQNRKQGKITEVYRSGWVGDYNDAYTFAEVMYSKHGTNDFGYDNPVYDALLNSIANETDMQERRRLLEQAERIVLTDHPIIPIYFYVSKHLVQQWVGGWEPNIIDHHLTQYLYIKKH